MIKVGITLDDDKGSESLVSPHFGQCRYFCLVDLDSNSIKNVKVVPNTVVHGGGGCRAVDALVCHCVTHVIAGGMGGGAQEKFARAGVEVFGYSGKAKDALGDLIKNRLGGLNSCGGHEGGCHS